MMKRLILIFLLFGYYMLSDAQQVIKLMNYNLLNFPNSECAGDANRVVYLKKIISEIKPDVLMVNELNSKAGADIVLQNALEARFKRATFTDGPDSDNMLFYDDLKFRLLDEQPISSKPRWVNYYKLQVKDSLAENRILHFFLVHLKSSTGLSNETLRKNSIKDILNYIDSYGINSSVIISGDFNFYSGSEPAYRTLVTNSEISIRDPLNSDETWHNDSTYSMLHTQSTRDEFEGCGFYSSGGLDDRFDFIFLSEDLIEEKGLSYKEVSYEVFGNSGEFFDKEINEGFSTDYSPEVYDALYNMSDHLPVTLQLKYSAPGGILEFELERVFRIVSDQSGSKLQFKKRTSGETKLRITDLKGQSVFTENLPQNVTEVPLPELRQSGVYIINVGVQYQSEKWVFIRR